MFFNIQNPVTTLLSMTSQWRFDKQSFILFINYQLIIVLFKQSPAAERVQLPAGRHASTHSAQRTERAAGQLSKFHHKGPVASKFAKYKPSGLSRVWCNVGDLPQAKNKAENNRRSQRRLQIIWSNLTQRPIDKAVKDLSN